MTRRHYGRIKDVSKVKPTTRSIASDVCWVLYSCSRYISRIILNIDAVGPCVVR